jgi:O-antigen biosynthesis protein
MKMLLIKIGKAWAVLRRDGVVRGGRRVFEAFIALFRPVPPGDILLVSGGVGDSARYRTVHVAEELETNGFRASVTVQDHPRLLACADRFSIFIFHRVLYTPVVAKLIARLKALNKEIIFETDDLVYDPAFLVHMDYYQKMNALERKLYENGVGGEILADPSVRVATTTTDFLAEKLRERGKQVFLVPNKLSRQDVAWADAILAERQARPSANQETIRVGYLSGTLSHNKDFATITPVLTDLLRRHPEMRLVLAGPLDTDSVLQPFAAQIERLPYMPRREYFRHVATLDINLAPLELGNPFCEAKSELKFFEAGIVGVPTVAVGNRTFSHALRDGDDGFLATTAEEWTEKIEWLMNNEGARREMGQAARDTALRRYTTESGKNEAYYAYLRSRLRERVSSREA